MAFQPIIYTFGASEYLNSIFESMSILFDFSKSSALIWLYRIAGALGLIVIVSKAYAARGADGSPGSIDWPWFIRFAVIFLVIVVPKTDVHIEDVMKKQTYVVTNAPWALSIFGWMTSSIGYGLTNIYENSLGGGMNPVEAYSGNGIAFGSRYYNTLTGLSTFSPKSMNEAVDPFVIECLIPAGTGPYNPKISNVTSGSLFTSNDLVGLIKGMNDKFLKNRYVLVNGVSYSCYELRTKLINDLDWDSIEILTRSGISKWQVITDLDNAYLKQATDANSNSFKQAMMINAIYSSVEAQTARLGDAATAASMYQAQAQFQLISGWRQASALSSTTLVWLHIVVEGMLYAIWTLCTFLFLFPDGWRVIMTYIQLLFWIQLWPIMYAILNSIIAVYATSKTNALALQYSGMTMSNFFQIGDLNGGIVTTAGYLSTMVPVISWMFLQRAGAGISSIAGTLTGSATKTAEKAGEEESKGNMMINKVTVKDTNFAGSEVTGEMTSKQISGTGSVTTVGGESTIQSRALENSLVSGVNYKQSASNAVEQLDSQIKSNAASLSKQWQNVAQSTHSATNGTSSGHSHGTDTGFGNDEQYNKLVEAIAQNFAELSAGVGTGDSGLFGVTANAKAGTKFATGGSNKLSQNLSNLQKYMDQNKYGDQHANLDSFNAVKGLMKQSGETVNLMKQHSTAQKIANSTGFEVNTDGRSAVLQSLYSQGYTPEQLNDMQYNDVGKFNSLMQQEADKFVRGTIGDTRDYTPDKLDSGFASKQKQLANTYSNNGYIDRESGKANQDYDNTMHQTEKDYQEMERKYHTGKDSDLVLTDSPTASADLTAVNSVTNPIKKGLENPLNAAQDNAIKKAQEGKVKPYGTKK